VFFMQWEQNFKCCLDELTCPCTLSYSLCLSCMKGTWREGSFTGDLERYVKQGSEMGTCFHRGPAFGEHGGVLLS
jgi:hypothetical protein